MSKDTQIEELEATVTELNAKVEALTAENETLKLGKPIEVIPDQELKERKRQHQAELRK